MSHAHSDHCSQAARILCTPETAALHHARQGEREAFALPFHTLARVGEADVTLLPAGHALGSAMLVAESAAGRVAYTGDYKLRPNPFSPPAAVPRVDELVMECTFGDPRYVFPPDDVLLGRLYRFVDEAFDDDAVPVVLAYALGKGQEAPASYGSFFLLQILGGMFEQAVSYLSSYAPVSAVHFAIALAYYGLLRVSDFYTSGEEICKHALFGLILPR